MTLFELKEKLATLNTQIKVDADWIAEKAADPSVSMEDIKAKTAHRDELTERRDLLQKQHDEMEAQQKTALKNQALKNQINSTGDPEKDDMLKAKAAFYKAALVGGSTAEVRKAYEGLGAIPTADGDLGGGENLLPTNMSNELITEPFETNSLRTVEQVTQITGLEEPKLLFSIEDADLEDITDKDTAKEIEMEGDTVTYGRFKTKIVATVKDTVLHGTATNLVGTIENALRSGLAQKEKMRAFATTADSAHKHMSFYTKEDASGEKAIKAVGGDNLVDAIIKAIADLPDSFSENASVVMRKSDYFSEINKLANNSATLWGKKPEDVIGYPVIFNDRAVVPIIGDFRYARMNYDIGTIYETDKDAKKGEYYFVLTAWGDHQIKLASAFRTAYARIMLVGAKAAFNATTPANLEAKIYSFNDGDTTTDRSANLTFEWQVLNQGAWEAVGSSYTGEDTNTLVTTSADEGDSFRCKVTYQDDDGAASVAYTNTLTVPTE